MRMGEDAKGVVIPSFHAYQEGLGGLIDYEHPDEGRGKKWSSRSTKMKTDEKQKKNRRRAVDRRKTTNKNWRQAFNQDGKILTALACAENDETATCENHENLIWKQTQKR